MDYHHPLLLEFPEHRSLIIRLREQQEDFRHMVDEYHAVDRQVCRIERSYETATDAETEELKKRRLHLKDQLYHEILKATGVAMAH